MGLTSLFLCDLVFLTISAHVSTLILLLEPRCKGIRPGAASAEALACSRASLFLA